MAEKENVSGNLDSRVAEVARKFKLAKENQDVHFERLRQIRQVYRAARDPSLYNIPTRAQYVVPVAFEKIEVAIPRIISVIFSTNPPVQSRWRVARDFSDEDLKLRTLDHLYEWHYNSNFTQSLYWKVYGWLKDALIFGQSYIKVGWKHKVKTKKVTRQTLDIMTGQMVDETIEEDEILEDGADVHVPSIFNLYFAPDAVAPDIIGTASWIIEHSTQPKSKVLAKRGGLYKDFDENLLTSRGSEEDTKGTLEQDLDRNAGEEDDYEDPMVDIYEYWTNDRLIVTANHQVLLRDEPNPFGLPGKQKKKPYTAAIDYLIMNELWQVGEVEMIKDIQNEVTTLRRMRTDVNNLVINPMFLINRNADINEAELGLSRPGGFVHAMPQDGRLDNAVRPIQMGSTTGLSSEEYGMLMKNADDVVGQHDYSVGDTPARRETATTVQLLQAAGNMRFDIKVRGFSHAFMEFNYMLFERWKQLLTKPHPLRIPKKGTTGFEYVNVTKNELPEYDDVDLIAMGDPSSLMKDARKQEIAQMYEIINNSEFVMPQTKLKALILVLKSKELEGVDALIQEVEQAQQMVPQEPSMNVLPPGEQGETPLPPLPPGPEGVPMVNEQQNVMPFPRPQR